MTNYAAITQNYAAITPNYAASAAAAWVEDTFSKKCFNPALYLAFWPYIPTCCPAF